MSNDPETLRLYASIFEKPRRYTKDGPLYSPMDAEKAAAKALRFLAESIESVVRSAQPKPRLPSDDCCLNFGCENPDVCNNVIGYSCGDPRAAVAAAAVKT